VAREFGRKILTVPNAFTMLRVVLLPIILWSILQERFNWALWMLVIAGISDGLDGYFARLLNQRSAFGMALDPIADKLLLSSSYLCLSMTDEIPWLVTGLILTRDLAIIITVVVLVLTTSLRKFPPNIIGKLNTVVQLAAVYAVLVDIVYRGWFWHDVRLVLVWATPVLVFASGIQYSVQMIRKVTRERRLHAALNEKGGPEGPPL
jgi:cardiolipin synthase